MTTAGWRDAPAIGAIAGRAWRRAEHSIRSPDTHPAHEPPSSSIFLSRSAPNAEALMSIVTAVLAHSPLDTEDRKPPDLAFHASEQEGTSRRRVDRVSSCALARGRGCAPVALGSSVHSSASERSSLSLGDSLLGDSSSSWGASQHSLSSCSREALQRSSSYSISWPRADELSVMAELGDELVERSHHLVLAADRDALQLRHFDNWSQREPTASDRARTISLPSSHAAPASL